MLVALKRSGLAAVVAIALSPFAGAQNRAMVYTADANLMNDSISQNSARVIRHANLHPEAAVSRSLAEQAVFPHLVEVRIGSSQMTTLVDPMVVVTRQPGEGHIDDGHWLARVSQNAGVTTEMLNEASASRRDLRNAPSMYGANRARLIRPFGSTRGSMYADYDERPVRYYMPVSKPRMNKPAPMPQPRKGRDLSDGQLAMR